MLVAVACDKNPLDFLAPKHDASSAGADASVVTSNIASGDAATHADASHDDAGVLGAGLRDAGARARVDASIDPGACRPACPHSTVCANGQCVCPFHNDVLCPKGCTNPKTDNFACGCTTGSPGATCPAAQECCNARCVACPAGQTVDPATCACRGGASPTASCRAQCVLPHVCIKGDPGSADYCDCPGPPCPIDQTWGDRGGCVCKPCDFYYDCFKNCVNDTCNKDLHDVRKCGFSFDKDIPAKYAAACSRFQGKRHVCAASSCGP